MQSGLVTEQQVQQALDMQTRSGSFLGQVFIDLGFISPVKIGPLVAQEFGVAYIDLSDVQPEPEAVALLGETIIRATRAVPLRFVGDSIEVAMVDPLDVAAIDTIHMRTQHRVIPLLSMAGELQRAINDLFDASTRTTEVLQELESEVNEAEQARLLRSELTTANEAPVVRLVDSILDSALASRASDIHFEPHELGLRVRFRVDGTLMENAEIPRSQRASVIARLKVLCLMDIMENRRPQDGRIRYDNHGRLFDIRVSSVPTVYGEKLVLRILDKAAVLVPLARLGFMAEQQKRFEALVRQPHGMVLVVGPTGSGKSTTLYASLNMLNDATRNIMTLEDPVEYNVHGLNQTQVNARLGLTFASGLRTLVRQDPDVILVGEIRDQETAEMAVQASLTGHLLLSTLHTNSAVGTVSRLVNLGLDPFLIAQALSGVVSQRLIARVCAACSADYRPTPDTLNAVGISLDEAKEIRFKKGRGCRNCHGRGYQGRLGVYEVLVMDNEMRRMVLKNAPETDLQVCAEKSGMQSLREGALTAVRAGITTPEEMGRVIMIKEG